MFSELRVEAFRVLKLGYPLNFIAKLGYDINEIKNFFKRFRAYTTHIYWCKILNLPITETIKQRIYNEIPSYWRDCLLRENDSVYLFKNIHEVPRTNKVIINQNPYTKFHYKQGIFVDEVHKMLIIRGIGRYNRIELPIKEESLQWLKTRLIEAPDCHKTARLILRRDEKSGKEWLEVHIVLRREVIIKPPSIDNCLLVVVDHNSRSGIVVHYTIIKDDFVKKLRTEKYKPPVPASIFEAYKLMKIRDNLKNLGCLDYKKKLTYNYLISQNLRVSGIYDAWIDEKVNRIVMRTRRIAKRNNLNILVMIDKPNPETLKYTSLQNTLLRFINDLKNLYHWYGVYAIEERLYSRFCPYCSDEKFAKMKLVRKTKRQRLLKCLKCGFTADRDEVPLYWALKILNKFPALKGEASPKTRR